MLPSGIADSCPHGMTRWANLHCMKIQLWSHYMIPLVTLISLFWKTLGPEKDRMSMYEVWRWGWYMEVWVSALGWWKMTSRRLNPRRSWWFGWCGDTASLGELLCLYTQSSSEPDIWNFTMVWAGRRVIRRKVRKGGKKTSDNAKMRALH